MRISIIGSPGCGKTTLAEALSKKLAIQHIQIDRFWFEAGGLHVSHGNLIEREKVRAQVREKVLAATNIENWISDGFYGRLVPELAEKADSIVYLKIPLLRRLFNHAKRMMKPAARHKELNWWTEITFFYQIVRRNFTMKPGLEKYVENNKNKVVVLESYFEVADFLRNFDTVTK